MPGLKSRGGGGQCMAGFDRTIRKDVVCTKDEWGTSYSSPTLATIQHVFGSWEGKNKPAAGGLLIFNLKPEVWCDSPGVRKI